MLSLIIVTLAGLAMAGFLIGVVAVAAKNQVNQLAPRIAQADELIAKARYWREEPQSPTLPIIVATKPLIQP